LKPEPTRKKEAARSFQAGRRARKTRLKLQNSDGLEVRRALVRKEI
jgi:hypothetical protein